ncbi:MAG: hypothetical protein FWC36_06970 [Spirochaetes bacterium]|nr:hypothetical protein [Spirochaetota bacterium]
MYRIIILLLFFVNTALVFPLQFFRSNSLGMQLAEISRFRIHEFEYYLEKITDGNKKIKILYKNSVPIRRTETHFSSAGTIQKEIITENSRVTERTFRGQLVYREKVINTDDQSGYIRINRYNSNMLLDKIEEFSLDGRLQNSIRYERDSRGRVASVIRTTYLENNERKEQISKYRFEGQHLLEEWHGNSDLIGYFIHYDSSGRISRILKTDGGIAVSEKRYFYDRNLYLRTEETFFKTAKRIIRNFTPGGLLTEEIIYIGERLVSRTNDYYDDDNRLVRRIRVIPEGVERYIFEYVDGELFSETKFFNGEIYRKRVYRGNDVIYEDFFKNRQRVLRIYHMDKDNSN